MEEKKDSICIKLAETDEELCGRGYVHCTAWQEAYRGIVCDRYLDTMTVEATTARARNFPENTLVAKDGEKVVGFAVYGPSRDEDLKDAGEVVAIYVLSEYYGRKIGYRLMNEAISRLKEYDTIFVWVFEKNERAIRFYHKYGFEFDGCKKEWTVGTPVTIVRMVMKKRSLRSDDMKCEMLAESNLALLVDFVDDVNTKYDETVLKAFLDEKNAYGYIAVDDEKAIGFAYGYVLNEPDGRKTFYLHAIDIMAGYQNLGYGTELVRYVHAHSKSLGCRKMFLLTNTGNVSACRCYEKAGGISASADVVMYEYKK